jgi:Na+(H+)/acetate symporter ActP
LLIADRLPRDARKAIGWTLLAIGVLTTVPIALALFARRAAPMAGEGPTLVPME